MAYKYDALGRLVQKAESGDVKTYSYDNLGRIKTEADGMGYTEYTYDANSNVIGKLIDNDKG